MMTQEGSSLTETLEQLGSAMREAGDESAAGQVAELVRKLREEQMQVVVMGEFKRGKSSLINALLGKRLLPVASIPLTAVVTIVKVGERDAAFVEFLNGRRQEIPVDAVEDYVSEERNHKNHKQVDRVIVETPSEFLTGGTLLVDTPGAGSVYRHNTEVAEKYLPNCDAVILVLAADPPISRSEVEFLHSVRRWARKLFIAENKIDYLAEPDLKRSVAFTEKVLRDALEDPKASLFPISAKLALEAKTSGDERLWVNSGFSAFTQAIQALLDQEKRAVVRESVKAKARSVLDQQVLKVELRLGALRAGADRWEERSTGLTQSLADAKRKQYELSNLYQAELRDHLKAMEESLYARVRLEAERVSSDLERLYERIKKESAAQVRAQLNRTYLDAVEDCFVRFLAQQEPEWRREFQQMTDRYLGSTLELVNVVLRQAAEVLGVAHHPLSRPSIAVAPPTVWFVLDEMSVWSGGMQSMPTLRVFKTFFWRALQRKVAEMMDVNAGRLRYDYSRRLERAGEESLAAIQSFFASSIAVLEEAGGKAAEGRRVAAESVESDASKIEAHKAALLRLSAELAA